MIYFFVGRKSRLACPTQKNHKRDQAFLSMLFFSFFNNYFNRNRTLILIRIEAL